MNSLCSYNMEKQDFLEQISRISDSDVCMNLFEAELDQLVKNCELDDVTADYILDMVEKLVNRCETLTADIIYGHL